MRNKQTNSVTNMEFYKHDQLFLLLCYLISNRGRNKVLLSVVWNPLLIEINLSQIRTFDIKREKVCAVCPYLLFSYQLRKLVHTNDCISFAICATFHQNSIKKLSLLARYFLQQFLHFGNAIKIMYHSKTIISICVIFLLPPSSSSCTYNISYLMVILISVCSNCNPLHSYRFGSRTRQINGVKCGLFSNYASLGQTTLLCTKTSVRSEGMWLSNSTHSTCHSHPSLFT